MSEEDVWQRQVTRDWHVKLRDTDLIELFKLGDARREAGVDAFYEHMSKLAELIRKSLSDRQTNPAILGRRYSAIMQRLQAIDDAVFEVRGGYANIWEALEEALDASPAKELSEIARARAKARHGNSIVSVMKTSIKAEWEAWQADRSAYRYPRDFRRAMMLKFPDVVDGTLKNWMSEWGKKHGR